MAEFMEWDLKINKLGDLYYVSTQNWIDTESVSHLNHNEIEFACKYKDGEFDIKGGWHIGTEDYSWEVGEGNDIGLYTINHYHKGLLEQVKQVIEKGRTAE